MPRTPLYKHADGAPPLKVASRQTLSLSGVVYNGDDTVPIAALETLPGVDVVKLIESEILVPLWTPAKPKAKAGDSVTTTSVERPSPPEKPEAPPPGARSEHKWSLDPASLAPLTLEQLNVKLAEMDPAAAPFTDADEARAFLSQDFVA